MPSTTRQRVPLGDLPLVDFLPHPNGATGKAHGFPSPLSLPSKRGPPTPSRGSPSTPKRRVRAVERVAETITLGKDDLGTGKSPARRLFVNESPATPATPRAVAASSSLAPSPPLAAARETTPRPRGDKDRVRDPLHDCGFSIYVDPNGSAKPPASSSNEIECTAAGHDYYTTGAGEENMPPCQGTPVSKHTRSLRSNVNTHKNSPAVRAA